MKKLFYTILFLLMAVPAFALPPMYGGGGGSGSASGSDTQVQFNDGGTAFGGDAGLTYNKTTDALTVVGTIASQAQTGLSTSGAGTLGSSNIHSTGTWGTGGTATTTKPFWLIEPTGTTSTSWSTSGTGLGVNAASGFTGNLIDAQLNGSTKFKVASTGSVTIANNTELGSRMLTVDNSYALLLRSLTTSYTGGEIEVIIGEQVRTNTSGSHTGLRIVGSFNQASGSASSKNLQILRTETALGSGAHYFFTMETATGFVTGFTNKGHLITDDLVTGTQPSLTTCGTTPAIGSSTDMAGIVTIGSGVTTACTITFGTAYTNEPSCTVTPQYNATAYISAKSNSAFTVTFSADGASQKFNYHCIGQNGGI